MKRITLFYYLSLTIGCLFGPERAISEDQVKTDNHDTAKKFIEEKGEKLFEYKDDAIEEEFPGGRSNKAHNVELDRAFAILQTSTDWKTFNKYYLFEEDYFVVEWFYSATTVKTGAKQLESTLGIGRIKDGKMILWKEYYDNKIGEYQAANLLPFYGEKEKPSPWPEKAFMRRPYRP